MTPRTSASPTRPVGRHGSSAAAKQPSVLQMLPSPRPCAGRAARRRSARVGSSLAQAPQEALAVEHGCEHVRAERRELLVEARARRGHELEDRAVELDDLAALRAEHQPRALRRPPPARASAEHAPRAGHPQMRVDDQVALEADEQVLAVGVDRVDPRARRGGRASGPCRSADAASRSRPGRGRRAPGGSGSRHGGSCRPRAWPRPAYGGAACPGRCPRVRRIPAARADRFALAPTRSG